MPGLCVRSPSSPGVGVGIGGSSAAPAAPNPNLLLWSEQAQQAAWSTDGVVTADAATDPLGGSTADSVALPGDGFLQQVSTTAATTGANASAAFSLTTTLTRYSVSGTFDGASYHFTCWLKGATGSEEVRLIISRSGGFLAVTVLEVASASSTVIVWGAKLETPSLTAYVKREGI